METPKQYGDRVLGAERQDRGVRTIALLVAAHTWEPGSDNAQRIPAILLDEMESLIEHASGGRKRTLLEVYDVILGTIEHQLGHLSERGRG